MRNAALTLLVTAQLLCSSLSAQSDVTSFSAQSDVTLSELLAFNNNVILDEDGDSSDFIELSNVSANIVDLAGWFLTDDGADLQKWSFPSVLLQPGEFLVVFASKKDRAVSGRELHTNFGLGGNGEYLALVMSDGITVATEFAPDFPQQFSNTSYGPGLDRLGNAAVGYFDPPTPGAANGTVLPLITPVVFDLPRGYLEAPSSLGLTCATPGVAIFYTLDSSAPSTTNGTVYVNPLSITSTSVVRAQAFFLDGSSSVGASVTYSYLFATDILAQSDSSAIAAGFPPAWIEADGSDWTTNSRPGAAYGLDAGVLALFDEGELVASLQAIPSISLSMPMDDWFGFDVAGDTFGIYPNSEVSGDEWFRACSAEYIDPAGGEEFAINCGIEIQGGSGGTRQVRSQLSLELKFDGSFGPGNLKVDLFGGSAANDFDRLILDAGNQNSIHSPDSGTMPDTNPKQYAQGLRDQFMMDLQRSMGSSTSFGRHVHVYINGLYWGMYNLHERPDQNWSSEHSGGPKGEYDEVRDGVVRDGNSNQANDPIAPGAWAVADDILIAGLDDDSNYAAFADLIDLSDYARYVIMNIWAGNREYPSKDWYASAHTRSGPALTDVNPNLSFRFHGWDGENVLYWGAAVTVVGDGLSDRSSAGGAFISSSAYFLSALKANPEFPLFLADEAHQHLFNGGSLWVDPAFDDVGTVFDPNFPERNPAASIYHGLAQGIESAVIMEYARWGNYFHASGEFTPDDWVIERDRILNNYFPIRSGVVLAQLRNAGLYPILDAPVFAQHGGQVSGGFQLGMTGPAGASIYYTLDGTDPRLAGGSINGTLYTGPVALTTMITQVKARAFDSTEWSALNKATFTVNLGLSITELMAANAATIADEAGEFDDWFELFNSSSSDIDLSGFYLTDDATDPTQWAIPSGTIIAAGTRLLFWADNDEAQGALHTNFKLSSDGDSVALYGSDREGNPLLATVGFGSQNSDEAHGLLPDGGGSFYRLLNPSPASSNLPDQASVRAYNHVDPTQNPVALVALNSPQVGGTWSFDITGAEPQASALFNLGLTPSDSALAADGFLLFAPFSDLLLQSLPVDETGATSSGVPIPNLVGLVGLTLYCQSYVQGATANQFSNALVFTIGS